MFRRISMTAALVCALLISAPGDAARPRAEVLPGPLKATVLNVLDGDTLYVRIHVWLGQELETDVRIAGIDTPELRGKCATERTKAQNARREVAQLLTDGTVVLSDIKLEKYAGRVSWPPHTAATASRSPRT